MNVRPVKKLTQKCIVSDSNCVMHSLIRILRIFSFLPPRHHSFYPTERTPQFLDGSIFFPFPVFFSFHRLNSVLFCSLSFAYTISHKNRYKRNQIKEWALEELNCQYSKSEKSLISYFAFSEYWRKKWIKKNKTEWIEIHRDIWMGKNAYISNWSAWNSM